MDVWLHVPYCWPCIFGDEEYMLQYILHAVAHIKINEMAVMSYQSEPVLL